MRYDYVRCWWIMLRSRMRIMKHNFSPELFGIWIYVATVISV